VIQSWDIHLCIGSNHHLKDNHTWDIEYPASDGALACEDALLLLRPRVAMRLLAYEFPQELQTILDQANHYYLLTCFSPERRCIRDLHAHYINLFKVCSIARILYVHSKSNTSKQK
jgi:hypothetical protein